MNRQPVYLYVLDTMADWEPGYAITGISRPAYQANPGRYEVRTVGARKEAVRTMGGVTIIQKPFTWGKLSSIRRPMAIAFRSR